MGLNAWVLVTAGCTRRYKHAAPTELLHNYKNFMFKHIK
jgi:hypothetical protein